MVFVPDRLFELRDRREFAWLSHLADDYSVRQVWLGGHRVHPADHHRLGVFGHEAGRAQAVGEVRWAIVPVQLPLEGLAALRENLHLPRDQLVEHPTVEPAEVAILDESAIAEANGSNEWAVPLDPDGIGKPVVHVRAQLRVIGIEQQTDVCSRHPKTLLRARQQAGESLRQV